MQSGSPKLKEVSNQRESQIDHVIDRINSTPEPTQASVQKQVSPYKVVLRLKIILVLPLFYKFKVVALLLYSYD